MSEVSFDAVKESLRLNCPEEELGPNKGSCSCSKLLFFKDALSWTCMNSSSSLRDVHMIDEDPMHVLNVHARLVFMHVPRAAAANARP